jgi:hypothetical protein
MAGLGAFVTGSWGAARRAAVLTLAVIALFLQVNAPVQALMMTVGGEDGGVLCAAHQPGQGDTKAPLHRQETCAVCSICALTGPVLAPTAMAFLALALIATVAVEILREVAPRGAPARAARARSPPLHA